MVSPHRAKRPWQGQVEKAPPETRPAYDPTCYLCPGSERTSGAVNPAYTSTYIFTNDFPALLPDTPHAAKPEPGLFQLESVRGTCRVMCFSPRHDLTLPEMALTDIRQVIDVWAEQIVDLGHTYHWVQIFENKGAIMGCSNPHPHGQIWAQRSVPGEPAKELENMRRHFDDKGTTLLGDYLAIETDRAERIVCENEHFVALVPFWAVWPFEVMVLCRRRVASLSEMNDMEKDALSDIIRRIATRYDNLFECSFPYSAGVHQAPTDGESHEEWDWHMHFYPPLLRSATVKKFMVGYEMLGNPQRDITPESSAARLRELSETHFKQS